MRRSGDVLQVDKAPGAVPGDREVETAGPRDVRARTINRGGRAWGWLLGRAAGCEGAEAGTGQAEHGQRPGRAKRAPDVPSVCGADPPLEILFGRGSDVG